MDGKRLSKALGITLILALLLVGGVLLAGGGTTSATATFMPPPSPLAPMNGSCLPPQESYREMLLLYLPLWNEATAAAARATPQTLGQVIGPLQQVRDGVVALTPPPCAALLQEQLVAYMDDAIDLYLVAMVEGTGSAAVRRRQQRVNTQGEVAMGMLEYLMR